jgi:hypothetical protein
VGVGISHSLPDLLGSPDLLGPGLSGGALWGQNWRERMGTVGVQRDYRNGFFELGFDV